MSYMIFIFKNRPKFVKRMKKTSRPEVFYVFTIFKLMLPRLNILGDFNKDIYCLLLSFSVIILILLCLV